MCEAHYDLFGGSQGWDSDDWTSSDDRVRGGKSQSYLECLPNPRGGDPQSAVFHGELDIKTLGGAGFASQRTKDSLTWDLSQQDGILIKLGKTDGKKYTLTLKDEVLPKRPDGREQSTVSWEYDFSDDADNFFIPWADFKPTYRGKPKPDARPLDLKNVQRLSIMMRSFFGSQEGPFRLELKYIGATTKQALELCSCSTMKRTASVPSTAYSEKHGYEAPKKFSWRSLFCGLL